MYLGEYLLDEYVTLVATTHRFSTGAAYAPSAITYRVYEDATNTEIITDTAMTNFDSETGLYLDRIQCTVAAGFEDGKHYTALVKATVDGVSAITVYTWRVKTMPANVTKTAGYSLPTGAVVDDAGNSATTFKTNRTEATTDYWKDALVLFTSGSLAGQVKKVSGYNGTTKFITVSAAFTAEPAENDAFLLVNV